MSIKSIPIEESSAEERRAFARNFLNLDLPGDASDDTVDAAIRTAQPGSTIIFVQEAPTPEEANEAVAGITPQFSADEQAKIAALNLRPEEQGRPMAGSLGKGDPRAVIEIPVVETDDGSGAMDALIGVNGRAWQLRRGQPLNVPWRVVEALQNAVADQVRHETNPQNQLDVETVVRSAKRVPFQILERPSDAAIEKWHEETDALFCA